MSARTHTPETRSPAITSLITGRAGGRRVTHDFIEFASTASPTRQLPTNLIGSQAPLQFPLHLVRPTRPPQTAWVSTRSGALATPQNRRETNESAMPSPTQQLFFGNNHSPVAPITTTDDAFIAIAKLLQDNNPQDNHPPRSTLPAKKSQSYEPLHYLPGRILKNSVTF